MWAQMGIEHALLPEKGLVAPGELIIGADSPHLHLRRAGRILHRRGLAPTWRRAWRPARHGSRCRPPSSLMLTGKLSPYVSGKDVILHIIGKIGVDGALYQVDGIRRRRALTHADHGRPLHASATWQSRLARRTASSRWMTVTLAYIKGRVNRQVTAFEADADAEYEQTIEIDLSALRPTVACPHLPENTKTIDELGHIEVQQVGHRFLHQRPHRRYARCSRNPQGPQGGNPGVRTHHHPRDAGSLPAVHRGGSDQDLHSRPAAIVSTPTCGPCLGGHMGILAHGENARFPPPTATLSAVWVISPRKFIWQARRSPPQAQ